jgi:UDP-GlcNAc:undecaprenyl-phosphate GlcNAc-1-phosphate transferase
VPDGPLFLLAFALAAALTAATVPLAITAAVRTGFLDAPVGYKAHRAPTPYLGGASVLAALLLAVLVLNGADRLWTLLGGAVGLSLVGTIDDRVNLSPWLRLAVEAVAAWLLWSEGMGWSFLGSDTANLLLTVLWVAGVVNAFNLMDNLDGAAASVAAVSAACVGALAAIGGEANLGVVAFGLCGALLCFLRYNLAEPARIFLGDGGSMPMGFLLAGMLMIVPMGGLSGGSALVVAMMAVGLPVFDTALVVLSRRRRGAPVFSGATDHTTHRLRAVLKSPRAVALALVLAQAVLCGLAIQTTRLGDAAAIAVACVALLLGAATIAVAEGPEWASVSNDS